MYTCSIMSLIVILLELTDTLYCAVPENIHTHPTEGHWNFQGGGGLKSQGKYEAKLEIPRGWGVQTKKTFCEGGMDIFWNHTL